MNNTIRLINKHIQANFATVKNQVKVLLRFEMAVQSEELGYKTNQNNFKNQQRLLVVLQWI